MTSSPGCRRKKLVAGPCRGRPRLAPPSSLAWVMKILEVERWLKDANPREVALLQRQQDEGNAGAPHLGARKVEGRDA
jgi:hypothetical protein